ncbi:MAG: rane protein [Pedosphaera sp.]|nr:rane protein [Pedosphaera sp.]
MSATPSTQIISIDRGNEAPAVTSVQIDASCRAPVLLLFISAAAWLLIGSLLGIIASLKFHSPNILASCPLLTYGRVHPAAWNALIYGFAIQAGLGVGLWVLSHLGRAKLAMAPLIVIGAILWNLGMTIGTYGILYGDSTGFEWLEMPRYASGILFFAYLAIGLAAIVTLHLRRERELYISQWLLLAAIFWLPWIYSTAQLLLVFKPVRGVMQAIIDWWYINNLTTIWLGFTGLAATFYFIPKIINRPLYSHYIGIFIFWTLAIFGSWGGIPTGSPLPTWIPALSSVGAALTIVPVLAVAFNVHKTFVGNYSKLSSSMPLKFIAFGALAYVLSGLVGVLASIVQVSEVINFTWFTPAQTQFVVYGFFAMTMFGAIYYIVPRLLQADISSAGVRWHFWLALIGVLIYVVSLGVGGVEQGTVLNNPKATADFMGVTNSTLPFLRASTTGDLFIALGHLVFLLNLVGVLVRVSRASFSTAMVANRRAEVRA